MIHILADFTDRSIMEHNYGVVKRCLCIADKLFERGNNVVKNAVLNVFVFSLTKMLQCCSSDQLLLQSMMPLGLYSQYINQVHHKGC